MNTQLKNTKEVDYQSFSIPKPGTNEALRVTYLLPIESVGDESFLIAAEYFDFGIYAPVSILAKVAKDGTLDLNFGEDGYVFLEVVRPSSLPAISTQIVEMQPSTDGSFLVQGTAWFGKDGIAYRTFMIRLSSGGIVDENFGYNGYFVFDEAAPSKRNRSSADSAEAPAVFDKKTLATAPVRHGEGVQYKARVGSFHQRTDGSLYLTACIAEQTFAGVVDEECWPFIVKLTRNGHYDPTFNGSGFAPLQTDAPLGFSPINLIPQGPDYEKFVISSYQNKRLSAKAFVARYMSDGSIDQSFGQNGFADFSGFDIWYHKIEELGDNSIIVASQPRIPLTDGRIILAKLTADGQFDISLNGGRPLPILSPYGGMLQLFSFFCDANGNITLAGRDIPVIKEDQEVKEDAVVLQRLPNGLADTAFGDNGFLLFKLGSDPSPLFNQIEPRPSDRTSRRFVANSDHEVILFEVPA